LGVARASRGRFSIYTTQTGLGFQKNIFETIRGRAESEGWNGKSAGPVECVGGANQQNAAQPESFMNENTVGFLICVTAIVMTLGTAMLGMYLHYRRRKDMFALYHQQRMAAIEKGIDLPPLPEDFFRENAGFSPEKARFLREFLANQQRRSPHRTLLFGLILLFIGLTLYPALHFTGTRTDGGGDAGLFALIPAGIGAAYLIYYFAVGRKLAIAMEEERKARLAEAARGRNPPA
jgi:hypothetical protein